MDVYLIIIIVLMLLNIVISFIVYKNSRSSEHQKTISSELSNMKEEVNKTMKENMDFNNSTVLNNQRLIADNEERRFNEFSRNLAIQFDTFRKTSSEMNNDNNKNFDRFGESLNKNMINMKDTLEKKVTEMQTSNEKKLDEMRATVDEKLQKTLEDRITQSFKLVSERLEQVHKSLGEMQTLSTGVDDLKKVLSNVKTRGILGEVQLGAILEQILSPEQYETNVATKKNSSERVEFAVKLPKDNGEYVYLPIDAKFPMDAYQNLLDAYDKGIQSEVESSAKVLIQRIKSFAKDINTKYIDVPNTTEFAILFLPIEGLYAEVVRRGMVEELQKMKISIAGPTTMAALLNSLQMGFRTLAIQKRSSEVWAILEGTKQEFNKFGDVLAKTQDRMRQASDELDKLVGTRTNAIIRKLKDVAMLETSTTNDE